jgi:predicted porin
MRLGRDYTPSFWNTTIFDPFGTNGVGSSLNVSRAATGTGGAGGSGAATYVRSNNAVQYFLPALGGFYGQFMVAPSEGASGAAGGKYSGGRLGFRTGPVDFAIASAQQETQLSGVPKYKTLNFAGSWKVGPANLMAQYNKEKLDSNGANQEVSETRYLLGASIVFGQGSLQLSYVNSDWTNNNPPAGQSDADATLYGIGYIYNLSPRTALYGTYANIHNNGKATFSVAGGSSQNGFPKPGGNSTGYEFGLRHSF